MLEYRNELTPLRQEFVLVCDRTGRIVEADPVAELRVQLKAGQDLTSAVDPDSQGGLRSVLDRAQPDELSHLEVRLSGADTLVRLRARARDDGMILMVGAPQPDLQDPTSFDEMTRGMLALHGELEDTRNALRSTIVARARLLESVSEELRRPLASILGLSKLLLDDDGQAVETEHRPAVHFIHQSADSISGIVDDLLDLSKLDQSRVDIRPAPVDIGELLGTLRAIFNPIADTRGVGLVIADAPPGTPRIWTDPERLTRLLKHLVSNALKHTVAGRVQVRVEVSDPEAVRFEVIDDGVGIRREHQAPITDDTHRLSQRLRYREDEVGLGLAFCRRLAEALTGSLTLESRPERGSTFCLRIPVVLSDSAINPEDSSLAGSVLIVDAFKDVAATYASFLQTMGIRSIRVKTEDEAIEHLNSAARRGILLELMPTAFCESFVRALRRRPTERRPPLLVPLLRIPGSGDRVLGVHDVLFGPVEASDLEERLERVERRRGPIRRVLTVRRPGPEPQIVLPSRFRRVDAHTPEEACAAAMRERPQAIVIDMSLDDVLETVDRLKTEPMNRFIPTMVVIDAEDYFASSGADVASNPHAQSLGRELGTARIRDVLGQDEVPEPARERQAGFQ